MRQNHRFAEAEKFNRSYVCRVLRLALLALEMVEELINSRDPAEITLPALMRSAAERNRQTECFR